MAGRAAHSWWARAAAKVSFESCPLAPSPGPHLCSHRDLDKEGDFVQEFSSQRRSDYAIWLCLRPSSLQRLSSPLDKVLASWPGINSLTQSGPWKPLGLLARCSSCLCPESHSYFLCESCSFSPPPSNISALPNSYSASKPQLKYPRRDSSDLLGSHVLLYVRRSHVLPPPSSGASSHLRVHAME